MHRIITLTTDFGLSDGYVGTMKGVILGINPNVTLVDLTHEIAPQNIEQGAFLFATAARYFPANAIHLVVVDPGVGSARRPIAIQCGETIFIAPDNGVLTFAVSQQPLPLNAIHLNRPKFFLPQVSQTFHGRDVFAPVAAHLALGVPLDALGEPIDDWVRLPTEATARRAGKVITGRVIHIDHFGNIITNIGEALFQGADRARITVTIRARVLHGIHATYASVAPGELIALISSTGTLEVAVRNGNAAQTLHIGIGDEILASS